MTSANDFVPAGASFPRQCRRRAGLAGVAGELGRDIAAVGERSARDSERRGEKHTDHLILLNGERRTSNLEPRTTNAERRTTNVYSD
jgi:hypothetical protein